MHDTTVDSNNLHSNFEQPNKQIKLQTMNGNDTDLDDHSRTKTGKFGKHLSNTSVLSHNTSTISVSTEISSSTPSSSPPPPPQTQSQQQQIMPSNLIQDMSNCSNNFIGQSNSSNTYDHEFHNHIMKASKESKHYALFYPYHHHHHNQHQQFQQNQSDLLLNQNQNYHFYNQQSNENHSLTNDMSNNYEHMTHYAAAAAAAAAVNPTSYNYPTNVVSAAASTTTTNTQNGYLNDDSTNNQTNQSYLMNEWYIQYQPNTNTSSVIGASNSLPNATNMTSTTSNNNSNSSTNNNNLFSNFYTSHHGRTPIMNYT